MKINPDFQAAPPSERPKERTPLEVCVNLIGSTVFAALGTHLVINGAFTATGLTAGCGSFAMSALFLSIAIRKLL